MNELYLYFTPKNVNAQLRLDDGLTVIGYGPVGAHGRPNGYHFQIPPNSPTQGGLLVVEAHEKGYQSLEQRGLVVANPNGEATFQADDFRLVPIESTSTPPKGELDEGKQEPTKPPPVG
jgi:hypothetical protein